MSTKPGEGHANVSCWVLGRRATHGQTQRDRHRSQFDPDQPPRHTDGQVADLDISTPTSECDPVTDAAGAPYQSSKLTNAAVQAAATMRLDLVSLEAYKREQGLRPPAARRWGRPPTPSTIPPLIRCSCPPRPSSSTSAAPGSLHRRCSPVRDAGQARARGRSHARAPPPRQWRPRETTITNVRSNPLPPKIDA